MARTTLNTRAAGSVGFTAADLTNGNQFANSGVVVPIIRVYDTTLAYIARFKAQVTVGPDAHLPHHDVPLPATGAGISQLHIVTLLDRYYHNNAQGLVEIDWLDADGTPIGTTPDIDIDLHRVADI